MPSPKYPKLLTLRVTLAQAERWRRAAEDSGRTLSQWLRWLADWNSKPSRARQPNRPA